MSGAVWGEGVLERKLSSCNTARMAITELSHFPASYSDLYVASGFREFCINPPMRSLQEGLCA